MTLCLWQWSDLMLKHLVSYAMLAKEQSNNGGQSIIKDILLVFWCALLTLSLSLLKLAGELVPPASDQSLAAFTQLKPWQKCSA